MARAFGAFGRAELFASIVGLEQALGYTEKNLSKETGLAAVEGKGDESTHADHCWGAERA